MLYANMVHPALKSKDYAEVDIGKPWDICVHWIDMTKDVHVVYTVHPSASLLLHLEAKNMASAEQAESARDLPPMFPYPIAPNLWQVEG